MQNWVSAETPSLACGAMSGAPISHASPGPTRIGPDFPTIAIAANDRRSIGLGSRAGCGPGSAPMLSYLPQTRGLAIWPSKANEGISRDFRALALGAHEDCPASPGMHCWGTMLAPP